MDTVCFYLKLLYSYLGQLYHSFLESTGRTPLLGLFTLPFELYKLLLFTLPLEFTLRIPKLALLELVLTYDEASLTTMPHFL